MQTYDPSRAPEPEEWFALDEEIRLGLIEDYHRRTRVSLPRSRRTLHALLHMLVENQVAGSDPPAVKQTLARLMTEGLDRHQAVHAVASVAVGELNDATRNGQPLQEERYVGELERLTAERWLRWNDDC